MQQQVMRAQTMQLATVSGDQPWICTVYFVLNEGKFYWLSFPSRRHSVELGAHSKAAIAIVLRQEVPVIGLQAEGEVSEVKDLNEVKSVLDLYIEKYGQGKQFVERFKNGENQHVLYCFSPRKVMRFDEMNHSSQSYEEVTLG